MEGFPSNPYLLLSFVILYLYSALCLMMIAERLGRKRTWMAWVPLLNVYYFLRLADGRGWWMIMIIVPFVNIAVAAYAFMVISEKCGRPAWWGALFLTPPTALFLQGSLAFGHRERRRSHHRLSTSRAGF